MRRSKGYYESGIGSIKQTPPPPQLQEPNKQNKEESEKAKQLEENGLWRVLRYHHDDEATAAVAVTDVEIEEVLKCELWMSDSANCLKSCFEHDRPG